MRFGCSLAIDPGVRWMPLVGSYDAGANFETGLVGCPVPRTGDVDHWRAGGRDAGCACAGALVEEGPLVVDGKPSPDGL